MIPGGERRRGPRGAGEREGCGPDARDPSTFFHPVYFIVSELDPTGALLWQRQFECDGGIGASSVAVNAADEVLVAGFTDGLINLAARRFWRRFHPRPGRAARSV